MNMKSWGVTLALSGTLFMPLTAGAEDLLTGDTRLACEAILCLSSGERPSECKPSIERYFSIKHKRPHKTISARKDFLNLCPSSKEENMPSLINALANGAGRCNAAELNRMMKSTYRVKVCSQQKFSRDNICRWETRSYVRNAKPSYCSAYFDHEWTTAGDQVRYIGEEKQGGRWVDLK